jgi:hypothetical protein
MYPSIGTKRYNEYYKGISIIMVITNKMLNFGRMGKNVPKHNTTANATSNITFTTTVTMFPHAIKITHPAD